MTLRIIHRHHRLQHLHLSPHSNVFLGSLFFVQAHVHSWRHHQAALTGQQIRPFFFTSSYRSNHLALTQSDSIPSSDTPTPSQTVRLRIDSAGHKRNSLSWTPEADSILLDLRAKGQTWAQIGEVLGKSRQACNRRFDSVIDPNNGASFWTLHPEKNHALKQLVAEGQGWKHIADQLGTKASACEKQWRLLERERILAEELVNKERSQDTTTLSEERLRHRFRTADVHLLKKAVAERGSDQWDLIATDIFESRYTAAYLRYQHARLERMRRVWTEQQDRDLYQAMTDWHSRKRLPTAVATFQSVVDTLTQSEWDTVARSLTGEHTALECRERWLRMQLKGTRQRKSLLDTTSTDNTVKSMTSVTKQGGKREIWTAEQSQRLVSIIKSMENLEGGVLEWDKISKRMNGEFTKVQCKSRWTRMMKQAQYSSTGPWDEEEIENLIRGVVEMGDKWTEISRKWVPGRTPTYVQAKWKSIASKLKKEMVIRRWTWQQVCVETFGETSGKVLGELSSSRPHLCAIPEQQIHFENKG
ncbi:hypothetical protein BC939DRAFT_462770 [Gamsiella multidivaricata]|uniref:uncharacterized protein n=1 Tax=Gamsiella multidivaricata TaxID=101098 RepID=UPI00221F8324|nr:uncharacterized protein BC939DRAFT_462770 [Gamsiella multidivaricata]KAG0370761.1 hypothetical protein BGZ54_004262 [Gamsiella multidivaricata]KAI7818543.1 hypothetical protein BC939DRAFT_462770 [Gamsiella multidivaricata]